jgi:hypothetical protein
MENMKSILNRRLWGNPNPPKRDSAVTKRLSIMFLVVGIPILVLGTYDICSYVKDPILSTVGPILLSIVVAIVLASKYGSKSKHSNDVQKTPLGKE